MTVRPSNVTVKVVMAATGAVFALFVLVHLLGNLKVFTGAEHFDGYAHWLRHAFEPVLPAGFLLWTFRIVMAVCLVAHLWAGWVVRVRGRRARGRVRRRPSSLRSWAAHSMPATGAVLLAFIVLHLLDLTIGARPAAPEGFVPGAAYDNLVASLRRWPVATAYIVAMLALCAHLAHGLLSVVVDFGVAAGRRGWRIVSAIALGFGLLVALGNLAIPITVLAGGLR